MPVYIRKNVSYTPPSLYNIQLEDDNDYLLDPDQLKDVLPQPYRMINKLLVQMLDNVWEICEAKENAILEEARKIRPPRLEGPIELEPFNKATSLQESVDGKYIFVGVPNGLKVMETFTQNLVHSWEDAHAEITNITTCLIAPDWHLVLTLDDMGVSRIFLFAFNHIFFIKALNEVPAEVSSKNLCQKCEASKEGDFAGFVFENPKEIWFELFKLPVEAWCKELETIASAIKQKEEEQNEDEDNENQKASTALNSTAPPVSVSATVTELGIKFSQPVIIMKIKPPSSHPLPANSSSSIASALGKIDTGDVLGVGSGHLMNAAHLDCRDAMFNHKHESMLKYLPTEKNEVLPSPTFHFVNSSRMLTSGLDSQQAENKAASVIVWWAGSTHLLQYSLLKAAAKVISEENVPSQAIIKNIITGRTSAFLPQFMHLDFKPDIVWPFTSPITCSAISSCSSHLAVGLGNGNLVLWNRQLGLDKAVMSVSEKSALRSIRFLDPSLFPMEAPHYPPYPVASATYLLTECDDGTQALFDTCDGSQQIPRHIATKPENDDDFQTLLKGIPDIPELIFYVKKNGSLFIKDIGTGAAVCEIAIPQTYNLQNPWEPILAIGGQGRYLFLKAEGMEMGEDGEIGDLSALFMYNLKSYKELESYWNRDHNKKDLAVYTTLEQRISFLMKERLQQQVVRKERMQKRWGQLRSELSVIQQAHAVPVETLKLTSLPSSIRSSTVESIHFKAPTATVL